MAFPNCESVKCIILRFINLPGGTILPRFLFQKWYVDAAVF